MQRCANCGYEIDALERSDSTGYCDTCWNAYSKGYEAGKISVS